MRKLLSDPASFRQLCEEWRAAMVEFLLRRLRNCVKDEAELGTLRQQVSERLPPTDGPVNVNPEEFLRRFLQVKRRRRRKAK